MKEEIKELDNSYLKVGLITVLISFSVFLLSDLLITSKDWFGIFMINYGIAIAYFIGWIVSGNFKWKHLFTEKLPYTLIFIILCFISCFSLNRSLPIFKSSTTWLQVVLIITSLSILIKISSIQVPKFIQHLLYFWLGVACIIQLYYALYLTPIYGIGLVGFFLFGISLHTFAPLFLLIGLIFLLKKEYKTICNTNYVYSLWSGLLLPCVIVLVVSTQMNQIHEIIRQSKKQTALPEWVSMSQRLPNNWITNHLLTVDLRNDLRFNDLPSGNFSLKKVHDPLFVTSCLLYPQTKIDYQTRRKIVISRLNLRHETENKLWRDNDLSTEKVKTTVELFPAYRMAYTEKEIDIKNSNSWSKNQQEALYTFYLPEGSVITSLSLWINGIEEKGYLTSKQKADSAYQTIVGRERRDPSLVTWKEGNTVTVRVFPCTPEENRKFKIGITSPLPFSDNQLSYENIYFKGPNFDNASEKTTILSKENLQIQNSDLSKNGDFYAYEGDYNSDWNFSLKAPKLSNIPFVFDGKSYQLNEYDPHYIPQEFSSIYLDINSSWTNSEIKRVWKSVQGKKVYIFNEKWHLLTNENKDEYLEKVHSLNFSLLPIHQLPTEKNALIISKASEIAPNLADLKNDNRFRRRGNNFQNFGKEKNFYNDFKTFYPEKPIPLYNIGNRLSPYLKTLRELRYFHYTQGELSTLEQLLKENKFLENLETDKHIVLHDSKMQLTESEGNEKTTAPDHLLRVFQYNHIMKNMGPMYFTEEIDTNLVNRAKKAYVVSPLSSLIVLETQNDYDRFGIKKSKNSLGNAGVSGAVPEPHEWALIILSLSIMAYLYFKKRKNLAIK